MKLKIKFNNIPKILKNGQFYTLSKDQFIRYDNKYRFPKSHSRAKKFFFKKFSYILTVVALEI